HYLIGAKEMNYKKYLSDNILKFWLDNAIDYENGGIFTSLDKNGKQQAIKALMGQAMSKTTGKANPVVMEEIIKNILK
ncbi:MAG: hypothetical protein IJB70_03325, partial [Clostridia bacterium]|nr:hypothetical protein [Clostridia bacterium]